MEREKLGDWFDRATRDEWRAAYLVDTNILINALNEKRGHRELLHGLAAQGHPLGCCVITISEVYAGMQPHEASGAGSVSAGVPYSVSRLAGDAAARRPCAMTGRGREKRSRSLTL